MNLHPYDRTMAFTSFYIMIPAISSNNPLFFIMFLQTLFSFLHWMQYNIFIFHFLDNILSSVVFIWHIIQMYYIDEISQIYSSNFCILALLTFYKRKGCREKAIKNYKIYLVIPHALFRFYSFWFVMIVHKQQFSAYLSLLYWVNVFVLSLYITG